MNDFPLNEGATLSTAVFGVPVGGLVQVWADEPTVWHLNDAAAFADTVGTGSVARTQIGPGRYREAALFDAETGTLMLQERQVSERTDESYQAGGRVFTAEPPSEVVGDPWDDLGRAVFRAAAEAFGRGELIVVEPGGWDDSDGRYCLIAGIHEDGEDRILLETKPAPTGSEVWPATDETEGQTIAAPASEESLNGASTLTVDAVSRWGVAPWDVSLTYIVPAEAFIEE